MIIEIRIPSPGESITEVAVGNWFVQDGDTVEKDQEIADVETDKATLPLIAADSGKIKIIALPGEKIKVGDLACTIDTNFKADVPKTKSRAIADKVNFVSEKALSSVKLKDDRAIAASYKRELLSDQIMQQPALKITPLARRKMEENNLSVNDIIKGLKKITTTEVDLVLKNITGKKTDTEHDRKGERKVERRPMSPLRRKLSKRLVAVKNETAMLSTFNEVDMSAVIDLRKKFQQQFQEKHGIKLGLMSIFTRAASHALLFFPNINSSIEGEDIITPSFVDIAIAVQTEKGLMVPVIRNAESMSIAEIEKEISTLAQKARNNRLTIEEMTGGTFTITNGGVFGSMLSTPILNPPQSAILGIHNIVERPVAIQGRVEIRPIMYVALSYDHRIIDGADSVRFLVKIKELIESPVKMLLGDNPEKDLLNI
jgi:2-oxoglutarate dehydrogenase E2 component (dihydrolipoamide succinyltransferase)